MGWHCIRTRPACCLLGDRLPGNRVAKVQPRSTSWVSRSIGVEPEAVDGVCGARHDPRVCSERLKSQPTGVDAIDTSQLLYNTPRSRDASGDTSTTLASVATTAAWGHSSRLRSGTGSSGFAVEATDRVSRGRSSRRSCSDTLCPPLRFAYGSGVPSHEPHQRRSRMVEISKSGSGEGPGGVIPGGYSTCGQASWSKRIDDAMKS